MDTELDEIRAAAKAVIEGTAARDAAAEDPEGTLAVRLENALAWFHRAANAETVLALVDEIERRRLIQTAADGTDLAAEAAAGTPVPPPVEAPTEPIGHMPEDAVFLDNEALIDHVYELLPYLPDGPWYRHTISRAGRRISFYAVPGIAWLGDANGALQTFIANSRTILPLLAHRLSLAEAELAALRAKTTDQA